MLIYEITNMKCCCVTGKCCLVKSCFVKRKIGKLFFFTEIIFLISMYLYTIQHLKTNNLDFYL